MRYPMTMATQDTQMTMHCPGTLIDHVRDFRASLRAMGAQAYHRICTRASFVAPDRIEGNHTTYVIRGGQFAMPPFNNTLLLQQHGPDWKGEVARSDVVNAVCPVLSPKVLRQRRV